MKKILFITLSNIGDCLLTLPSLDFLRRQFPQALFIVVASKRAKDIFVNEPGVSKVIVFDKQAKLKDKIKLFFELKREGFDMVVDLRNSFYGAFLPVRYRISPFLSIPFEIQHMHKRHLFKVRSLGVFGRKDAIPAETYPGHLNISPNDEGYINSLLKGNNISDGSEIIVVAPGARSHIKRWPKERFAEACGEFLKEGKKVVLVGDDSDIQTAEYITNRLEGKALNLCGRTSIRQLAALLKKASLLLTNDSAVLHLGSYLNIPVLAVFGPTNEAKYGPWSDNARIVKREIFCRPCEKALCRSGAMQCMGLIKTADVLGAASQMLGPLSKFKKHPKYDFKRILIARTDRIGDVVLSTPVIKAMRDEYPDAYIAMMVAPAARDVVEGNPLLDEVIVFDKDSKHKSWYRTLKFARNLKKRKFDVALILHPTNRVHLAAYLAGIPKRVGYDRKMSFLLTDKLSHAKQSGERHELEYNLDLAGYLGAEPQDKELSMQVKPETQAWADQVLKSAGVKDEERLLAIHPAASCPSKIWPKERFAQAADALVEKYGFKVLILAGPKDMSLAQEVEHLMRAPSINLAGRTSVAQMAALLKRCRLFISNDSGPVHVSSAVGTPVISIFGRSQKGLSPRRWGPVGENDMVLHKDVGCIECLAHNCTKGFECLGAITVEDVLNMVDLIFKL